MPRLSKCPETGRDLDTVDIAKHCQTLWPTLDPRDLPNTEAGARYKALMEEHTARVREQQKRRTE